MKENNVLLQERDTNDNHYNFKERQLNKDYYKQRVEYLTKTLWKENNVFKINPLNLNNETLLTNKNTVISSQSNLKLPQIGNIKMNINAGNSTDRSEKAKLNAILEQIDQNIKSSSRKNLIDVKINTQKENKSSYDSTVDWSKYERVRQHRNIYSQN
jgi:hypothetical protein